MKILFIYLTAYCGSGGIEKFNATTCRALVDIVSEDDEVAIISLHDKGKLPDLENRIKVIFCAGDILKFSMEYIRRVISSDILIIGHLNLSLYAWFSSFLNRRLKLLTIVHGIEAWGKLSFFKRLILKNSQSIAAVSRYTANRVANEQKLAKENFYILPNSLPSSFRIPAGFIKPDYLIERYGIAPGSKILLTLCRISSEEGYKGYDKVIIALSSLVTRFPDIKYIIGGKYDDKEKMRIDKMVSHYNLEKNVLIPGYISDEELTDHYLLADLFIMPSYGEGFGIVFIEAAACGVPVIAGNKDGSREALADGELGILVDPEDENKLMEQIEKIIIQPDYYDLSKRKMIQEMTMKRFNYEIFRDRLKTIIYQTTNAQK